MSFSFGGQTSHFFSLSSFPFPHDQGPLDMYIVQWFLNLSVYHLKNLRKSGPGPIQLKLGPVWGVFLISSPGDSDIKSEN